MSGRIGIIIDGDNTAYKKKLAETDRLADKTESQVNTIYEAVITQDSHVSAVVDSTVGKTNVALTKIHSDLDETVKKRRKIFQTTRDELDATLKSIELDTSIKVKKIVDIGKYNVWVETDNLEQKVDSSAAVMGKTLDKVEARLMSVTEKGLLVARGAIDLAALFQVQTGKTLDLQFLVLGMMATSTIKSVQAQAAVLVANPTNWGIIALMLSTIPLLTATIAAQQQIVRQTQARIEKSNDNQMDSILDGIL